MAESLRALVAGYRFEWQGVHFQPNLSAGLVPFALDAGAPAALLSRAEAACHLAKEKGRDRVQVYDEKDRDIESRSGGLQWMAQVNEALAQDRFTLYCQPMLPVAGGGRRHGEVLVRMRGTDDKLIPASSFIPQAERYGLMPRLDRVVVHKALALLAPLYAQGRGEQAGVLAINLSGMTLSDPALVPFIREEMRLSGVPPSALCFEITETAAVSSLREAAALINSLRGLGCGFALDDFGRGMSSFMYLKQLPVDYLKIDGAFVRSMADDPVARAMVRAIHALGQAMGIATVAECVETAEVRRQLQALGVDYVQGFEVGPPQPLSALSAAPSRCRRPILTGAAPERAAAGMRFARSPGGGVDDCQPECRGGRRDRSRRRSEGQSPGLRRHAHHRPRRLGRSARRRDRRAGAAARGAPRREPSSIPPTPTGPRSVRT